MKSGLGWQNLVTVDCAEIENRNGAPRTELANATILYKFHCTSNIRESSGHFF